MLCVFNVRKEFWEDQTTSPNPISWRNHSVCIKEVIKKRVNINPCRNISNRPLRRIVNEFLGLKNSMRTDAIKSLQAKMDRGWWKKNFRGNAIFLRIKALVWSEMFFTVEIVINYQNNTVHTTLPGNIPKDVRIHFKGQKPT